MLIPSVSMDYLFSFGELSGLLEGKKISLKKEVGLLDAEKIKEIDEEDYIKELVTKYAMIAPEIRQDDQVIHEKNRFGVNRFGVTH